MAQPKYVYETTFLVKRGTKEQWEKENPILECGEIGYVIDENSIKIGDGSSYWTELGYVEDERLSEYGRVTVGQAEGVELGKKATSEGDQTQATGETAHAEGNKTIASGRAAHAQGNSTEASGKYSHAEGEKTIAAGDMSHAAGKKTEANAKSSHAEGQGTCVDEYGEGSHAEGLDTYVSAHYAHVEGAKTKIYDRAHYSHAEGKEGLVEEDCEGCHVEGYDTLANNYASYAHAEGHNAQVVADYSHAEGIDTIAGGEDSIADAGAHAEGHATMALARGAHSEGDNTEAQGKYSHAEGLHSISYGEGSHAEGIRTSSSGYGSHAEGEYTIASGRAQHVSGKYNIEDDDDRYAFIVGNGTSDSERNNAFMVEWTGDAKLDGYLDILGLKGNTVTRNLYVGGARNAEGDWEPTGLPLIDATDKNTIKNSLYISTMKVPRPGTYFLTLPEGSNYLYKIQIIENGRNRVADISSQPIINAGQYAPGEQTDIADEIWITFGSKTRIDSNTKTFSDGFTGYKRLNFQGETEIRGEHYSEIYPSIEFWTSGPAEIKIWWVAGEDGRYFAIQTNEGAGSSRLEVTGNFIAHGPSEFKGTAVFEDVEIDGRLETKDIHVDGFIETSESIECGGSIKVDSEIKAGGTATFENDVKIKNNSNREHTVKLRDALHEALDFDFKKRIPLNAPELIGLGGNHNDLKSQITAMREISATTLTLDEEEYTFEIGDEPIEIWKDLTLKGINEKPVVINFNYTGTADEFTVFRVMAPELKINFENLVINSERVNGGYGRRYFIKCEENAINLNLLLNKIELQENTKINIYQGNSIYLKESKTEPDTWSGSVKNFYVFDDKKEFAQYYEKLTDYINITDNYQGYYSSTEGANCSATGASHAEGVRTVANPEPWLSEGEPYVIGGAHAEGYETQALATPSHAEGYKTVASEDSSHAEGRNTTASGKYSHAEGYYTTASGNGSHAEGFNGVVASGWGSHAEGNGTKASADASHAEGSATQALGPLSHAEGGGSIASGDCSHAEGDGTIAASSFQHAQGTYNIEDTSDKYAHIVGNGTMSNRSNAHTLDWGGNAWYAGDIYINGTSQDDENAKKLATEEFVTNALSGVEHPTPDLTGYATEDFVNTAIQQNAYTLPTATTETIGGVKVGNTLDISADGVLNVKQAETPTELYLMSPDGLKFKITVSDVGALLAEQVV